MCTLLTRFSVQQFWVGKFLHLVSLRVSFSRRNLSVQQVSCVRISFFLLFHFLQFTSSCKIYLAEAGKSSHYTKSLRYGTRDGFLFCWILGHETAFFSRRDAGCIQLLFLTKKIWFLFRGIVFPGNSWSGDNIYSDIQYSRFCLKVQEIVLTRNNGTVQTSWKSRVRFSTRSVFFLVKIGHYWSLYS